MNKAAIIATIALLPVLAYAPLTNADPGHNSKTSTMVHLDEPLQVGDTIANFEIPNPAGGTISLDEMLADGPVVMTFSEAHGVIRALRTSEK